MASELKPLRDYVSLASGNTPSKSNSEYWGGATPWVSAKDMSEFWLEDSEDHLTEAGVAAASRIVPAGTVLMLTRGMTLHNRVPICRIARDGAFNQDVKAVLPKDGLYPSFLPYLLTGNHDRLHERVDAAGHGTGRLNTDAILSLPVHVPATPQQISISQLGEALDGRSHNLRQTNVTLEAITQALFKSWFVDFEPVRANAEGREPQGMGAATAALFPSEFEDSELGPIPKGWHVEEIGRAVSCVGGATPSTKDETFWAAGIHHWATPKDLSGLQAPILTTTERLITDAGVARISSGLLPAGTLLMSSRAPIGYLAIAAVPTAINQGFIAMPPGGQLPPSYLLFWARTNMELIKQKANGSTFMEISKAAFRPIRVVVPSAEVITAFSAVAEPLLKRIELNERHKSILAETRDTLLPRLISGKLRLPEVDAAVTEVTT